MAGYPNQGGISVMWEAAKRVAQFIANILVIPMLISYWVRSKLFGRDRALQGSTQALAVVPGIAGRYIRRAFLARVLSRCDRTATIEFGSTFSHVEASVGEYVYIGPNCNIGFAQIERGVLLGPGVQILSGPRTHGIDDLTKPIHEQPIERRLVRIGRGSWIGTGAIIMADVGSGSVIGAGAVVTKPIPEGVVATGVPARVVRNRGQSAE
jgi:virginiamycin A acetyltransferase